MPYKSSRIKISGTKFDRRQKLTEEQKDEIRELYKTGGTSQRKLAVQYGVSRRLITYIIDPEKLQRSKEINKINRHKYKPSKEEWSQTVREHRRYKQQLFKDGKIDEYEE